MVVFGRSRDRPDFVTDILPGFPHPAIDNYGILSQVDHGLFFANSLYVKIYNNSTVLHNLYS